jgi:hypothetical protein
MPPTGTPLPGAAPGEPAADDERRNDPALGREARPGGGSHDGGQDGRATFLHLQRDRDVECGALFRSNAREDRREPTERNEEEPSNDRVDLALAPRGDVRGRDQARIRWGCRHGHRLRLGACTTHPCFPAHARTSRMCCAARGFAPERRQPALASRSTAVPGSPGSEARSTSARRRQRVANSHATP